MSDDGTLAPSGPPVFTDADLVAAIDRWHRRRAEEDLRARLVWDRLVWPYVSPPGRPFIVTPF